jgi:cysteine desulfurase NifS/selenium donor protein
MQAVYLDYNATTPIDREVADFMMPFLRGTFGNPSSVHSFGIESKKAIENARKSLCRILNCSPSEIIFTSGGTESNNFAIMGVAYANRDKGNHIITSNIEHPAIMEVCKFLEKEGFSVSYLQVNSDGIIEAETLRKAIRKNTILITIMHANNETGTIQNISELSALARKNKILFHTDAAQSVGKIKTNVREMGIDLLSVAGHKFYAPKGIGALYIRDGVTLTKIMHGANHEHNLRPGTENVLEIAGLGKAAEIAVRDFDRNYANMEQTRDLLYTLLKKEIPTLIRNGHKKQVLPNTLNVSFPGMDAGTLLSELEEVAASAGAACHAETIEISYVLKALKLPPEAAMGTIRFSTGKYTTREEIIDAAAIITLKAQKLMISKSDYLIENKKTDNIKLTHYTHGLGCACKINPRILEEILRDFPVSHNPDILVGTETSDDAAVYKINDETALVQTVDFFTPVIDEPFEFGAIAAANALSDIYAMGARPIFALNIAAFPLNRLPLVVLQEILKGAQSVADEAGISILGGHTIEDNEPKFGMAVSGIVHPSKIIRNSTAKPGDLLILTKPLGTGILSTALKRNLLSAIQKDELYKTMRKLNKKEAEIMVKYRINACTDITGFGLLGHLKKMLGISGLSAELDASSIPQLTGVLDLASQGLIPGGTLNNINYTNNIVQFSKGISQAMQTLLADAQTSGGLLISVSPEDSKILLDELKSSGNIYASEIGRIKVKKSFSINVFQK